MRYSNPQIDDLNSRLRKLEALLAAKNSSELQSSATPTAPRRLCELSSSPPRTTVDLPVAKTKHENQTDIELEKAVKWLETDALEHEPSPPGVSCIPSSWRVCY